jgi:hypothetical protein
MKQRIKFAAANSVRVSRTFVCGKREFLQGQLKSVQDGQSFGQAHLSLVHDEQSSVQALLILVQDRRSFVRDGLNFVQLERSLVQVQSACERCGACRRRLRLERLARYCARPPIAMERLEPLADGRLLYRFKRSWRDGTTHVVLDPLELLEKLAALACTPSSLDEVRRCACPGRQMETPDRAGIVVTFSIMWPERRLLEDLSATTPGQTMLPVWPNYHSSDSRGRFMV